MRGVDVRIRVPRAGPRAGTTCDVADRVGAHRQQQGQLVVGVWSSRPGAGRPRRRPSGSSPAKKGGTAPAGGPYRASGERQRGGHRLLALVEPRLVVRELDAVLGAGQGRGAAGPSCSTTARSTSFRRSRLAESSRSRSGPALTAGSARRRRPRCPRGPPWPARGAGPARPARRAAFLSWTVGLAASIACTVRAATPARSASSAWRSPRSSRRAAARRAPEVGQPRALPGGQHRRHPRPHDGRSPAPSCIGAMVDPFRGPGQPFPCALVHGNGVPAVGHDQIVTPLHVRASSVSDDLYSSDPTKCTLGTRPSVLLGL